MWKHQVLLQSLRHKITINVNVSSGEKLILEIMEIFVRVKYFFIFLDFSKCQCFYYLASVELNSAWNSWRCGGGRYWLKRVDFCEEGLTQSDPPHTVMLQRCLLPFFSASRQTKNLLQIPAAPLSGHTSGAPRSKSSKYHSQIGQFTGCCLNKSPAPSFNGANCETNATKLGVVDWN